ncbi:MAG: PEP-CTERM sorting domain-containing protein [Verrucomicrobiota bacterium]
MRRPANFCLPAIVLAALLAAAPAALGQTFIFAGEITNAEGTAFDVGDEIVVTLTAHNPLPPADEFTATLQEWDYSDSVGIPIFSNLEVTRNGTPIQGSWQLPGDNSSIFGFSQGSQDFLTFLALSETDSGLSSNGIDLLGFQIELILPSGSLNFPQSADGSLADFLPPNLGGASLLNANLQDVNGLDYFIDARVVPEPTSAALLLAAAGLVALRRRSTA